MKVILRLPGSFKQYEVAVVAADERGVVRVRSNVRGEDVRLYRLRMTPENAQALLCEYAAEVDDLAQHPRSYNTMTAIAPIWRSVWLGLFIPSYRWDIRILLSRLSSQLRL
jgi:hypothetical protein